MIKNLPNKMDQDGWFGLSDTEWVSNEDIAFLVIDMQNYNSKREWKIIESLGLKNSPAAVEYYYNRIDKTVVPNIQKLLNYFRTQQLPVFHTANASRHRDNLDRTPLARISLNLHERNTGIKYTDVLGERDTQIIKELKPMEDEFVLHKTTASAFLSTNMNNILHYLGVKKLIICGSWLNSCVESTIRDGRDLGYLITLAEDGAVAPDEDFHTAAVRVLGSFYCNVKKTDDIINLLTK
jgi:nicotinamidase-related amidase